MTFPNTLLRLGALFTASMAMQCGAGGADGPAVGAPGDAQVANEGAAGAGGSRSPAEAAAAPEGAGPEPLDAEAPPINDAPRPRDSEFVPNPDASPSCPSAPPANEAACFAMATCPYDGEICTCPRHPAGDASRSWSCFTAPVTPDATTCPSPQPRENEVCAIEGLSCRYGRGQCLCGGRRNADDTVWSCQ